MPKVIPFGDRILVKRNTIGEKAGAIYLPDEVKDRHTDLAVVVSIPELTFGDKQILENAEKIIESLTEKASNGDSDAMIALLRVNEFCKMKSIQPGDSIMVGKYVGVTFTETGSQEELTLVREEEVIGLVVKE